MRKLLLVILILLGLAGLFSVDPASATAQSELAVASRLRKYLRTRAEQPTFSAAILVVWHQRLILREAYGMADFELGVRLKPDHIFRIGSLTKPFTATAILWLREKGRLNLSSSVCDFLHDCPAQWRPVTVSHLLSHTSGIPDLFGNLKAVPVADTRAEIDRAVKSSSTIRLEFDPGSRYSYSNFNYCLLGYIIEAVTGKPWEIFLLSTVISATKESQTRYDDVWSVVGGRVHGYEIRDGHLRVTRYTDHAAYAAGGLRSTLDDLWRWHDSYWKGQIISKSSILEALNPRLENYGYGWQVTEHFGKPLHNHTGSLRGFASHLAYYPNDDLLIIVLSNVENENAKGTACDLAALTFNIQQAPTGTQSWTQQSNDKRCGVRHP